jgi:hypothetical protein
MFSVALSPGQVGLCVAPHLIFCCSLPQPHTRLYRACSERAASWDEILPWINMLARMVLACLDVAQQ